MKSICEIDVNQEINIVVSSVINQENYYFAYKVEDRNTKLENHCKPKDFVFINNSILDSSNFKPGRRHLNQKGTSLLCRDFAKCVKVCCVSHEKGSL